MRLQRLILGLPVLVVVSGLFVGCGSGTDNANVPPPKPSTPEDQKKAAASVYAGQPKIAPPGAPAPKAPGEPK